MPNNNKQAKWAKYSNLSQDIAIATLEAVALPLLIADTESFAILLLTKLVGGALLLLSAYLFYRWKGNDLSEYRNEFFYNDGTPIR